MLNERFHLKRALTNETFVKNTKLAVTACTNAEEKKDQNK